LLQAPLDKISVMVSIPVSNLLWFGPIYMSNRGIESETVTPVRQGESLATSVFFAH
jgi:hypothetical protein